MDATVGKAEDYVMMILSTMVNDFDESNSNNLTMMITMIITTAGILMVVSKH